jgi:hypothetical protein
MSYEVLQGNRRLRQYDHCVRNHCTLCAEVVQTTMYHQTFVDTERHHNVLYIIRYMI